MSKPNTPNILETVSGDKKPVIYEQPESYYPKSPAWRFYLADYEHPKWSVLDSNLDVVLDPSDPSGTSLLHTFSRSIDKYLLDCLTMRETTTWAELLRQSGGRRRGTNSHHIPLYELSDEAQARATEIGLHEDVLFSLRLNGTHRVFGTLDEHGILNIVWFDRQHEICPVNK